MILEKGKKVLLCIGAVVMPVITAGALFVGARNSIRPSSATGDPLVLNSTNQPVISNNTATRVDDKNITWEYNGVQAFADGHVTLNHQGYFGVSSSSAWGITAITSITVKFTSENNSNELWLLHSVDGTRWEENCKLESNEAVTTSNNWRYVRFYCWSDTNTSINITSVSISYNCSGTNAREDVDNAKVANVLATSENLSYTADTGRISGDTAISFSKTGSSTASSYAIIGLNRTYTLEQIRYKTVEFDYYKVNTTPNTQLSYPSVQLYKNAKSSVGSTQGKEANKSHYKTKDLGNDWYHVQMPITALAPTISGYYVYKQQNDGTWKWVWDDAPSKTNQVVGAIKLTVGTCRIDNLRFGSSMDSLTGTDSLGIFNNGTSFNVSDEKPYWFKVAWAGEFQSCTFAFSDPDTSQVYTPENPYDPIAKQVSWSWNDELCRSPFYIKGLYTGTVVATAIMVVGYNRRTVSISNTLTIN